MTHTDGGHPAMTTADRASGNADAAMRAEWAEQSAHTRAQQLAATQARLDQRLLTIDTLARNAAEYPDVGERLLAEIGALRADAESGVLFQLPASHLARPHTPADVTDGREDAARICEAMRPQGGRMWTEGQSAAYEALTAAADAIRRYGSPEAARGGEIPR